MFIDLDKVLANAIAWEKDHPPNTGYTEKAFRAVVDTVKAGRVSGGTNVMILTMLQFTGKEELGVDQVNWDSDGDGTPDQEERLAYSKTNRWSLDQSGDCSSVTNMFFQIFFGINIGTSTLNMYSQNTKNRVAWKDRRQCDVELYNFKDDRPVSHAATIAFVNQDGSGSILQTTSPSNPFRLEADTYAAKNRVTTLRVLTDEQLASLIVPAEMAKNPVISIDPATPAATATYRIKGGDNLTKIAKQFNTSVDALLKLNPQIKDQDVIIVGDTIKVSVAAQATPVPVQLPQNFYAVKPRDTMYDIAKSHGITLAVLEKLNPQIKNPSLIRAGDTIRIK